jgi:hypothetical protein
MNGGIDTLRTRLEHCEIMPNANIRVDPATIDYQTGLPEHERNLFVDERGNLVRGKKAYCNDPFFQFDITFKGIFVKSSIPLIHSGGINNLLAPNSSNDFKAAIEQLENELYKNGIKANLLNGFLSRVDFFKMIESNLPYPYYDSVYGNLLPSRLRQIDLGYDSFLFVNNYRQIAFYDKHKEMIDKHNTAFNCPNNSHRHEIRFTSAKSNKANLKIDTCSKLVEVYPQLPEFVSNYLSKEAFKWKPEQFKRGLNQNFRNDLLIYQDKHGRNSQQRYWSDHGLMRQLSDIGKEVILEEIGRIHGKQAKSVMRKRIAQIEIESKFADKSAVDLYSEIRSKAIDPNYEFRLCA